MKEKEMRAVADHDTVTHAEEKKEKNARTKFFRFLPTDEKGETERNVLHSCFYIKIDVCPTIILTNLPSFIRTESFVHLATRVDYLSAHIIGDEATNLDSHLARVMDQHDPFEMHLVRRHTRRLQSRLSQWRRQTIATRGYRPAQ